MKIVLNPEVTRVVEDLKKQFPEGTAVTHIINLAIRNYSNTLGSNPGNTNGKPPTS